MKTLTPEEIRRISDEYRASTPGPWRAIQWNCNQPTTVVKERPGGNPLVICECSGHGRYAVESLGDARLIAAAPDLLEALEVIRDMPYEWTRSDIRGFAADAIRKAKGEL
jgi:hypothetical protein